MKKFMILWRMSGGDEIYGWREWQHSADSYEEAEEWLKKRFDELFVQCSRDYKIIELTGHVAHKAYDTRKRAVA